MTPAVTDFSIAATPVSQIAPPGATINYTVQLVPLSPSFDHPIGLTVTGLPTNATYSFASSTATPGSQAAAKTLTISVPQTQAKLLPLNKMPSVGAASDSMASPASDVAAGGGSYGHSRHRYYTGGYFSQAEQTYTVTITGTSGILVHSTTVTLTVE
ncbi:hypothetical protein GOB94_00935 [Granulicella sp. 5B5]|uniref:hypothetical protein n=1 Tax=Granulicella sp. 5B5 TaxID=1617967 RepID=UPI00175F0C12|nr:hypothetical protein [Granulicella sp. 5B5]QMV17434.1 hypothetical protein GOB94_00935 [Granulicella sp. 5B5]